MTNGIVKKKNPLRITVDGVLESILVILMILNCNSIYGRLATTTLYIEELITVLAVLLFIICNQKIYVKRGVFHFVVGVELLSLIYLLARFSSSDKSNFIFQFIVFLPCMVLYLSQKGTKKGMLNIYDKFAKYIFIISTLSTVVWVLAEILHVITPNVSVNITWGRTHIVRGFYGLYFETQMEGTFGIYLFRNTGIFCEAPMHSLVLTLALIYEMFLKSEKNKTRVLILCLYIATTFSLTGILCIAIAFLLKYWTSMSSKRRIVRFLYYIVFSALAIVAITSANFLINIKSVTGSYTIRMIDYIVGVRAWMDNPIFGTGYNVLSNLYNYKTALLIDAGMNINGVGFSNSLTAILGQGGLTLTSLYLLAFIVLIAQRRVDVDQKNWSIMMLILLTVVIFHARFIMFYFISIAYILAFNLNKSIGDEEYGRNLNYDVSCCS